MSALVPVHLLVPRNLGLQLRRLSISRVDSNLHLHLQHLQQRYSSSCPAECIEVNGSHYRLPSAAAPLVGICLDGSSDSYISNGRAAAQMPTIDRWLRTSTATSLSSSSYALVTAVMPTFTNPNNVGISTGTCPAQHGVSGNYFYDESLGVEQMMNESKYVRVPTIFAAMQDAGVKVIVCTTKNKLLPLLSAGLDPNKSIFLSAERADHPETTAHLGVHGVSGGVESLLQRRAPAGIYDPAASLDCLEMGWRLLEHQRRLSPATPVLVYLSTSDYVQHKFSPGHKQANDFYGGVDRNLDQLDRLGAIVGVTADHGMSDKTLEDRRPRVIFLKEVLRAFGVVSGVRLILSITDPYVVHHAGLGSFATLHFHDKRQDLTAVVRHLRSLPGIYTVLGREDAARELELPADRIGDVVVVADGHTVLGSSADEHDLDSAVGLRSHGSFEEMVVPMFFNRSIRPSFAARFHSGRVRNFQLYELLCNALRLDDDVAPSTSYHDRR